jgi:long-chain acyl-CoA synthetase
MNICEHVTRTAKLFPDKEAIVFEGQRVTFAELDGLSQAAAAVLTQAGVSRGDRVALMLPNVPAFAVWYYGALRIGAIAVSISTRLAATEVDFVISDCDAKILIALSDTLVNVENSLPDCLTKCIATSENGDSSSGERLQVDRLPTSTWVDVEPDDAALILYTSGTTGFAKGATLSHMNVRSNVHAFNHLCNMQPADRILLTVPLFHCFGQNALLNSALNVGATLVLQRKFDPGESKQLIVQEQVTQLYAVPMMFQLFHDSCEPSELSSVQYCFSAAATLPIQTSRRWQEKFGMPIYEGYGLTETSPFASYNHRLKFIPGSIGTPIDCVEMKIVDTETGKTCAAGELGEIAIRGPNVMLGYWNRPADTADAIRDGWFHSGDIGRMDEQGYFYIVDRVKDMIAVGGLKVYPAEVERVLLDHPVVAQAAVVGFPDDVFGEQVLAFIVPADTAKAERDQMAQEIIQHAQGNLANYKVPRQVVFIDELPRNPSGKILKTKLREMDQDKLLKEFAANDSHKLDSESPAGPKPRKPVQPTLSKQLQQTHAASRKEVANTFVQNLVQTITVSDEVFDPETRFLDAGLDSLMIVEMSSQIQVEVGPAQEIPATLVFDHPRIGDLAAFLVETLMPAERADQPPAIQKPSPTPVDSARRETEIASMSEQQALEELMKELEA